jgi:hypothetical protein
MARLNVDDTIDYEREKVFETFRDDLEELQQFLPNIVNIEQERYERKDDDTIEVVRRWTAEEKDVPTMARKFIKPEMLQWTDYAIWKEDEWVCDWEMEVGFLQDAISCKGQNRYIDEDGSTRIVIDGDLEVDATQIPGVPRLVASKVGSAVESFVVKLIEPNLTDVNRGLERYLDSQ